MSDTTNINNSIYEFELALVNTKSGEEIYLPLPKGAVEYLEIEDNLANFGLVGKCRLANFYSILQQLKVMDVSGLNCMYVSIKNTDFNKMAASSKTSIDFLSLITRNSETSNNVIDKSINLTFEDYFVARTRMESIVDVIDQITDGTTNTPGRLIYELFKLCNKESVTDLKDIKNKLFVLDGEDKTKVSLCNFYDGKKVISIFDLINELYKYCSYENGGPAIISNTNIEEDGIVKRKITLQPISKYTSKFYELYQRGTEDLSEYVTEEFIVGDSSSNSALNTNFIDSYNFIRVDQDDVLSNKWVDYMIASNTSLDLTKTYMKNVTYMEAKSNFSTWLLNGSNPNLPDRSNTEKNNLKVIHKKVLSDSESSIDDILTTNLIKNTLIKSFIYDNTAITFSVQGNTYREAGKFIRIRSKDLNDTFSDEASKNVDGYWFILTVKHIFKGNYYTNEYVCVKLHTSGKFTPSLKSPLIPGKFMSKEPILSDRVTLFPPGSEQLLLPNPPPQTIP